MTTTLQIICGYLALFLIMMPFVHIISKSEKAKKFFGLEDDEDELRL